jgi:hypothetical protein
MTEEQICFLHNVNEDVKEFVRKINDGFFNISNNGRNRQCVSIDWDSVWVSEAYEAAKKNNW